MDWTAIRLEVRAVRKEAKAAGRMASGLYLQKITGVNPSTLNRIESVEKYPNHKPDLETVEALLSAMGVTLSAFFTRLERDPSLTSTAGKATAHDTPAILPVPAISQTHVLVAIGETIADAIDRAVQRLIDARGQTAIPRVDAAKRPTSDRKSRRSNAR